MNRYEDRFINRFGEVKSVSPKRDKFGHIVGFYDVDHSEQHDVVRWIRRDLVDGTPYEIAVCRHHYFESMKEPV